MPVITWVRTGTDNQKVQFAKAELPKVKPPMDSIPPDSGNGKTTGIPRGSAGALNAQIMQKIRYDADSRMIRLERETRWTLLDVNGVVMDFGFGCEIRVKSLRPGMYFVRTGRAIAKVLVR